MVVGNHRNNSDGAENMSEQTAPRIISFHCGACGTDFGKTQRELNLYGLDLNCPNCHASVDGEQEND